MGYSKIREGGIHLLFCTGLFVGSMFGIGIMTLFIAGKQEDQQFKRE